MRKRKKKKFNLIVILLIVIVAGAVYTSNHFNLFPQGGEGPTGEQETTKPTKPVIETNESGQNEEPRVERLTIAAVGDIIYHMSQIHSAYNFADGTYDFKPYFELIKPLIESADISVANYEGTTAGTAVESYMAYPRFNAPDETLDAIKYAGFDVISTINNHALDMRKYGLVRTLEQLHQRGFKTVGTYVERPETGVLFVEEKDIRLAFIAYTFGFNGMDVTMTAEELANMTNLIDRDRISEDIDDAIEAEADLIIAIMHWGNEYQRNTSIEQRELADFMFSNGVDIILGSHPHVIQDAETVEYDGDTKFVIYSMGNFISNQRQESLDYEYPNLDNFYTEDGVIVNIEIEKDFDSNKTVIKDIQFTPTWVNRYKKAPLYHYDVIPIETYLDGNPLNLDDHTLSRMERSYRDTMIKFDVNLN
ncbi:MAG: Putative enzyme of poly-gamma-glutamate biosynthesis (Capsule formation) [Clostridiales bacterium 38_11]|nr:MAG: Putative enzyme of poly-gamma-glutamate biosynthesis (Capsule formation) [Clostridiales bacterium 38_11]HBH12891.1 poly-gamma-glutamate biosynthesis protein [Clostridiales bacterium]